VSGNPSLIVDDVENPICQSKTNAAECITDLPIRMFTRLLRTDCALTHVDAHRMVLVEVIDDTWAISAQGM
jgi:hypothetical protein